MLDLILIALTFDRITIAMIAVFVCFSVIGWVVAEMTSRRRRRAEERLEQLRETMLPSAAGGAGGKKSDVASLLEKAAENLSRPLESKNEKDVNNLKTQLANAGFRSEFAPTAFRALKFGALIFGFVMGGGTLVILTGTLKLQRGHESRRHRAGDVLHSRVDPASDEQQSQGEDLPRPTRCAGLDGGLRRSRPGSGSGHAEGLGGNEKDAPGHFRGIRPVQHAIANGPRSKRRLTGTRRPQRRRRPEVVGVDHHSGGQVRIEYRQSAPRPK